MNESALAVAEGRRNAIVFAYGAGKTGKSSLLFGPTGYAAMAVDIIFKEVRDQQVQVSFVDCILENVRDFAKYYKDKEHINWEDITLEKIEKDSCEMKDNSDDPIQVRNLTRLDAYSYTGFMDLMRNQNEFRDKFDSALGIN